MVLTGYLPAADEPWKIIERAEFLIKLQPRLPYNLIGHNCEHIANMCVSGGYAESHQVRAFFGVRGYMSGAFMLYLAWMTRPKRPVPRWAYVLAGVSAAVSIATTTMYHHQIKKFWDEIRPQWRDHERALAEDPRNGLEGRAARPVLVIGGCPALARPRPDTRHIRGHRPGARPALLGRRRHAPRRQRDSEGAEVDQ